jgi:hypothetical protein
MGAEDVSEQKGPTTVSVSLEFSPENASGEYSITICDTIDEMRFQPRARFVSGEGRIVICCYLGTELDISKRGFLPGYLRGIVGGGYPREMKDVFNGWTPEMQAEIHQEPPEEHTEEVRVGTGERSSVEDEEASMRREHGEMIARYQDDGSIAFEESTVREVMREFGEDYADE